MLFLVSREFNEDGISIGEIEFEIGKYDNLDHLLINLKKMHEAKSIQEVNTYYFDALMHIKNWAVECFSLHAKDMAVNALESAKEERVRSQGGI